MSDDLRQLSDWIWQTNYKSMSFDQLLEVRMPIGISAKERKERAAFIATELQIKAALAPKQSAPPSFDGTTYGDAEQVDYTTRPEKDK